MNFKIHLSAEYVVYLSYPQTRWLKTGDLEVTATLQYKKNKPSTHQIIFSASKGVEYFIEHYDGDESEYRVEQSTDLVQNEDESVYLYESFTVNQDASGTTSLSISVMEVNDHSDPSERFQMNCTNF